MNFEDLLAKMLEMGGSDMFLTVGKEPCVKVRGKVAPLVNKVLDSASATNVVYNLMNEEQKEEFDKTNESNFAIDVPELGRFRVNVFRQKSEVGAVLRVIVSDIPTLDSLNLPPVLKKLIMIKQGLVLFVGGTGTGKSTSLAAMLKHRNESSTGHILTVEDPVEYVHNHKNCIITQREVGIDTASFEAALKSALRQAPDVVLIGEIRSLATMQYALRFSETGHLCLATLHANNANQAIDRVVNFFPPELHDQVRLDLAGNLKAIVAQRLVPTKDGKSRAAAVEVMVNTPTIATCIAKGEIDNIKEYMQKGAEYGMQTFDQSLFKHFASGRISLEDALKNADSENDLRLAIKFAQKKAGQNDESSEKKDDGPKLSLKEE